METLPIGLIWRVLSWLPAFILRILFSKRWLAEHTYIDVRPRNDPVVIRGGELPELEIWLTVSNRSHFTIELDRLVADFIFGAAAVRSNYLKRTEIHPNAQEEILLRTSINAEQILHISKNKEHPYMALRIYAEFNSKIHNFPVDTGDLSGLKPEFQNV